MNKQVCVALVNVSNEQEPPVARTWVFLEIMLNESHAEGSTHGKFYKSPMALWWQHAEHHFLRVGVQGAQKQEKIAEGDLDFHGNFRGVHKI
jgi:hypothetical protein